MSAPPYMRRRKTSAVVKWLLIDTTEILADCWGWSPEEIGRAWLNVLNAVSRSAEPDVSDELTRVLWSGMRLKQRTGRAAIAPSVRAAVFERDGRNCSYCGCTSGPFELDHVHPVSRGGRDTADNLAVACEPCNRAKAAKTVPEWVGAGK